MGLNDKIRLHDLDGIRGWASVSVVLYHLFLETFGVIHPSFQNLFSAALLDGDLAVCIFFLLSGEVLSIFYYRGDNAATCRLAIKRYFRLCVPVFFSCLIVFILVNAGLTFNIEAGSVVDRPDWLGQWLAFPMSVGKLFRYSFVNSFIQNKPDLAINPFLWTMRAELFGSYFVFMLIIIDYYIIFRLNRPYARPAFLFAIFIVLETMSFVLKLPTLAYFGCFVAGMMIAQLRVSTVMRAIHRRVPNSFCLVLLAAVFTANAALSLAGCQGHKELAALPILVLVHVSTTATAFFSNRLSLALGRISFPLYLVQFPILVSVTSFAIVHVGRAQLASSPVAAATIAMVSFILCIVAAHLFLPVEVLTGKIGNLAVEKAQSGVLPLLRRSAIGGR
jgi:peptidoglycan/LPS O-acetylase OafA/YrhL